MTISDALRISVKIIGVKLQKGLVWLWTFTCSISLIVIEIPNKLYSTERQLFYSKYKMAASLNEKITSSTTLG